MVNSWSDNKGNGVIVSVQSHAIKMSNAKIATIRPKITTNEDERVKRRGQQ